MSNALLKNLGVGLIVLSAILSLVGIFFAGDLLDEPIFTWGCAALVVIGLIAHIFLNKYLPLDDTDED